MKGTTGTVPEPEADTAFSCRSAHLFEEQTDGLDAAVEIWDVELLVGSVQIVIWQAEAHHHAGNLQHVLKVGYDGNRATGADEDRLLLKDIVQRFCSGLDVLIIDADHARRALSPHLDLYVDTLWRNLLYVVRVLLENVIRVLVWHQPHGYFGCRLCRNDGLGAGCGEAAGHAVHFHRGACPQAVKRWIFSFADKRARSDLGLAEDLILERQPLPSLEFVFCWHFNVFVETGNQNAALRIFQLADDLNQAKKRVRRSAAVHARVQIGFRPDRFQFRVNQATQPHAESRQVGRKQLSIADQREVGLELRFLLANVFSNRFAAHFLFTLDDNFYIQRQLAAVRLHERFECFHLHPELAFVIDRAASIDVVIALGRFEGRGNPFIERVGRLHVVVRIAEYGRFTGRMQPIGVHQRVALCGDDLHVFQTDPPQLV